MIKYTTREIIKRAEQLTDFTDSRFVSPQEKVYLLNDSYSIIYQSLINANDKTFLKKIELSDCERLPKDIYKIHTVYSQNGELLKKKGDSQNWGYDIIDNRIVGSAGSYIVHYYPEPKTLFLKDESKIDISISEKPISYSENFYAVKKNNNIYLYDTETNNDISNYADSYSTLSHFQNGIVDFASKKFYPYGSSTGYDFDVLMIRGNVVTLDKVVSEDLDSSVILYVTDTTEKREFFITSDLDVYADIDLENQITTLMNDNLIYCREDGLYIGTKNTQFLKRCNGKVIETIPMSLYKFETFIDDTHIIASLGNNIYKIGYGFDSFLEHPNQVFYSYLAYDLAISFCNIVERDSSELKEKADEIRAALYESIPQDINESYTIKDVNQGRWNLW